MGLRVCSRTVWTHELSQISSGRVLPLNVFVGNLGKMFWLSELKIRSLELWIKNRGSAFLLLAESPFPNIPALGSSKGEGESQALICILRVSNILLALLPVLVHEGARCWWGLACTSHSRERSAQPDQEAEGSPSLVAAANVFTQCTEQVGGPSANLS